MLYACGRRGLHLRTCRAGQGSPGQAAVQVHAVVFERGAYTHRHDGQEQRTLQWHVCIIVCGLKLLERQLVGGFLPPIGWLVLV